MAINQCDAQRLFQESSISIGMPDDSGQIVGAIVIDKNGDVVLDHDDKPKCFRWSDLTFIQKKTFYIEPNGELIIGGESQGRLIMVVAPDKDQLYGHDDKPMLVGIFLRCLGIDTVPTVRLMEMNNVTRELVLDGFVEA